MVKHILFSVSILELDLPLHAFLPSHSGFCCFILASYWATSLSFSSIHFHHCFYNPTGCLNWPFILSFSFLIRYNNCRSAYIHRVFFFSSSYCFKLHKRRNLSQISHSLNYAGIRFLVYTLQSLFNGILLICIYGTSVTSPVFRAFEAK